MRILRATHLGMCFGVRDALRLEALQDGRVVDEVTEDREGAGIGAIERERDGIANAEAHAEMGGSQDSHDSMRIYTPRGGLKSSRQSEQGMRFG